MSIWIKIFSSSQYTRFHTYTLNILSRGSGFHGMGMYKAFYEHLQAAYKSEWIGYSYDYEGQVHLGIMAIIV